MSFWQRISTDASNTANDVYSHWILGDDAGKSALTTFIYRPNQNDNDNTNNDPKSRNNNSSELGMTFIEINRRAYVKSVVPNSIAHRAGVLPQDAIQLAIPIRPQWELDAMQLNGGAGVGDDDHDDDADIDDNDESQRIQSINRIARTYGLKLEKKGARTSYNQLVRLLSRHVVHGNHNDLPDDPATTTMKPYFLSPLTQPLTQPKKKSILSMLTFSSRNDTLQQQRRNGTHNHGSSRSTIGTTTTNTKTQQQQPWDEPPTPSKLCGSILLDMPRKDCISTTNHDYDINDHDLEFQNSYLNFDRKHSASTEHSEDDNDDDDDYDNYDDMYLRSRSHQPPPSGILLILRRTRQRQVSQETASCFVPASFRLDDECDLACTLVRRLAPTADMEAPVPDTWEELVHDGTDWLLGHSSMLPPKGGTTTGINNNISGTGSDHVHDECNNYYAGSSLHHTVNGGTAPATSMMNHPQHNIHNQHQDQNSIPLDAFEQTRTKKLATLRSRITAETMLTDRTDDVEAATVRAMIQKAVGLAFVRASKIVLGVSIHGGSGIVISRLPDGTWSAPSAIGTWGLGLGLQFGLEVAEYIFILQTQEAMQHFKRGGSYTVGGNMGIAIGGLGREAYGAASVGGGGCGTDTTLPSSSNNISSGPFHDEDYNDDNDDSHEGSEHRRNRNDNQQIPAQPTRSLGIAPIVAYAKSQGLYIGVSLEGSRIFTRNDINCRTYKFSSGRDVTADDILSGKVPTPPEAEELYAALHSVEFTHEMSRLPRPPEVLRNDSANAWNYDRSITITNKTIDGKSREPALSKRQQHPFSFLSDLSAREADECTTFEAQFKNFLYGGVSVQRLIVDMEGGSDRTGKERRTLWLMLPEVGSLRIGFVSKLSDGEGAVSNKSSTQRARRDDSNRTVSYGDNGTVGSEELTLDSALITKVSSNSNKIFCSATDIISHIFVHRMVRQSAQYAKAMCSYQKATQLLLPMLSPYHRSQQYK